MKNKILSFLIIVSISTISLALYLNRTNGWGNEVNGLVCRISPTKGDYKMGDEIEVLAEFKNVTSKPLVLFDSQDYPSGWPEEASYFRFMVLGFNRDPTTYHLLTSKINKLVTFAFRRRLSVS